MNKSILGFSLIPLSLFVSTAIAAPGVPPGQPFQGVVEVLSAKIDEVKDDVADVSMQIAALADDLDQVADDILDAIATVKDDTSMIKDDVAMIKDDMALVQADVDALANNLQVELMAYTDSCESGSVQCNSDAADQHTFDAASSANHNPFPVRILVTRNGVPVNGITAEQFSYSNNFVPAGGTGSVKCDVDCGDSWFQGSNGNGLYSIYIDRNTVNDLNNWKAGNYSGVMQVSDSQGQGSAMVSFSIE